jgi:hypothetical protein
MKKPTSVYFFKRPDGYYKIGISHNPHTRLREVSTPKQPLTLFEFWTFPNLLLGHSKTRIARSVEARLHQMFIRKRHEFDREFFELSDDDLRLAFKQLDVLGRRSHLKNPHAGVIPQNPDPERLSQVMDWLGIKY